MVYLYKKKIGTKTYYYLRASSRKGNKVIVKDIAYLGSTLEEVKKALAQKPQYAEKIRKAYRTLNTFLESNHYLEKAKLLKLKKDPFLQERIYEVEACQLHYNTTFNSLALETKKEILKNFVVEFTFNTTSMEGNTISLQEARNLLQEGTTPKDKTLREIYDIQNTEAVFFKIMEMKEKISHKFIVDVHRNLMHNIDARVGYRTGDVHVIRSNFEATPAPYVLADMKLLLQWYDKNNHLHPLVLATAFHHKFEKIHPFMDGNGRTGRLLFNYILLHHQYPPIIIRKKTRNEYLQTLRQADNSPLLQTTNVYKPLITHVAQELVEGYWNIFL